MKLRKLAAFILAGALLASQMVAVNADEQVLDGTVDHDLGVQAEGEYGIMLIDEAPIATEPTYVTIGGKITESNLTEIGLAESIVVSTGEDSEIQLNLSAEETVVIDAEGMPVSLAGLEVGTEIYAAHSMAQTMSLPPQSSALAIVVLNEDEVAPKYMEVKAVSELDGKTAIESADGNLLIAVDENTVYEAYKTRNIVGLSDIKEGSKLFVWYGASTKSIPEQAVATKIMILPAPVEVTDEEEKETVIVGTEIGGIKIDFAKYGNIIPKVENGITFLPVRAIAETAGASVTWDGATGTIVIEKAGVKAELKIGSDKATVAGEEVTLAAAPKIVEDRTVIGVSVDLDKYGFKFITE